MQAAAFDELAGDYDADFTHSPVGSALRAIVGRRFEEAFQGARRVLDLGSGTGEDAIRVAASGAQVLAIDASAAMVRTAQDKARRQGCASRIEFRCLPIESLASAETGELFDGVLSNFGALNCVKDLPAVTGAVAAETHPSGRALGVGPAGSVRSLGMGLVPAARGPGTRRPSAARRDRLARPHD